MSSLQAWERILFEWKQVHRLKTLNQRLYDQLGGSIIHIIRYAEENNIPLPNRDKLYELVDKAENVIDEINAVKLPDESLQSDNNDKNRRRLDITPSRYTNILWLSANSHTIAIV
jgi:tyrosine-protein phosphatase YwqE